MDVGEVHFETVFGLVGFERHGGELAGCVQGGDGGCVNVQGAERGCIGGAEGQGEGVEIDVVGGAEDEDAFARSE